MGGGLFVEDDYPNESADYSKSLNYDFSDYQYDPHGIRLKDRQEWRRADSAIISYIAKNKVGVGSSFHIPVETDKDGGAYSYTVTVTGEIAGNYVITERLRIIQ